MTKKKTTKPEELIGFAVSVRESEGLMDTPWGSELRMIERRVAPLKGDPHNADALQARWESGLKLVEHYDNGELPSGHLKELAAGLRTTQKELKERLNLAKGMPTEYRYGGRTVPAPTVAKTVAKTVTKADDKKPKSTVAKTDESKPKTWRDVYPIHPVAEVFPLLKPDELQKLADTIKKEGLHYDVIVWCHTLGGDTPEKRQKYVLDGRNRLDAMELLGMETVTPEGGLANSVETSAWIVDQKARIQTVGAIPDPADFVISMNVQRRHLTKKEQSDLIVKAVMAEEEFAKDSANRARSFGPPKGQKGGGGSTKDPVKEKVVERAAKVNISKRTAEQSLADAKPKSKHTFVTCPECSGSTADLDKHMATKHKSKRKLQVVKDSGPKDRPPTKKRALNVLKGIALNVDAAADVIEGGCGDPATLATYDEAQELMVMVADGSRQLAAYVRRFAQEREALAARKGGSR